MRLFFLFLLLHVSPLYGDLIDDIEIDTEELDKSKKSSDTKTKSSKNKNIDATKKEKARSNQKDSVDHDNKKPRRSPIKINSSGTSTFSKKNNLIVLNNDVVITQEDLRLESDKAKIYIRQENGEEVVDRAVLNGGVHVSKFDSNESKMVKARGDKATFFNKRQIVELDGNARLWKGGHLIKGKKIIYDLNSGMISVDEARGVVQPGELKND